MLLAAFLLVAVHVPVPCASDLPPNIRPGPFGRDMQRLLDGSATFRGQCRRLAAVPYVRVIVSVSRSVPDGARAQTLIERFEAGAVIAFVTLRFGEDYLELIPHELEHVIEQVDRVRLAEEAAAARAWRTRGGAFETDRAVAAGLRARQEVAASVVEAIENGGLKAPTPRHPIH